MKTTTLSKSIAALLLGATTLFATLPAQAEGMAGHERHGRHGMKMGEGHGGMMLGRLAADATPEQKAKLREIGKAAHADLKAIKEQQREGRKKGMALLTAAKIDRAALESLRVEQMRLHDRASQRMSQAMADMAEVLTPEQRAKIGERMAARHARRAH